MHEHDLCLGSQVPHSVEPLAAIFLADFNMQLLEIGLAARCASKIGFDLMTGCGAALSCNGIDGVVELWSTLQSPQSSLGVDQLFVPEAGPLSRSTQGELL